MYAPPLLTEIAISIWTQRYFGPVLVVIGFALVYLTFWVLVWLGLGPMIAAPAALIVLLALLGWAGTSIRRHAQLREREAAQRDARERQDQQAAVDAAFQNALRDWDERTGRHGEAPLLEDNADAQRWNAAVMQRLRVR